MRTLQMIALLTFALLASSCAATYEAFQVGTTRTAAASSFGVSSQSPVATAALVQVYEGNKQSRLIPVDTETGLPVDSVKPVTFGEFNFHTLSPDGRLLATLAYPNYESTSRGTLLLTDLETWTTVTTTVPISNVMSKPVFSPDGAKLALIRERATMPLEHMLQILEITRSADGISPRFSARRLGESAPLSLNPVLVTFSSDGNAVHFYGSDAPQFSMQYNPQPRVATYNATTLLPEWEHTLMNVRDGQYVTEEEEEKLTANYWDPHIGVWWQPGRVFSPDGNLLYLVHAHEDRMTTVDFARERVTGRSTAPQISLLERLLSWTARPAYAKILNGTQLEAALNHDGSRIYVTGRDMDYANDTYSTEFLPLRIIDSANGRLLGTGEKGTIVQHSNLDLRIFLSAYDPNSSAYPTSEWTIVADPATGATMQTVEDWTIFPARRLDGTALLLGSRNAANVWGRELAIIDPLTFAPTIIEMDTMHGWGEWIAP